MLHILRDIPATFFSAALYRRVAGEWTGAFPHLVTVLLLAWGAQSAAAFVRVGTFARDPYLPAVVERLPRMVIEQGVATIEIAQPYVLPEPDGTGGVAIFDTTGRTTGFDDRSGPGLIFLSDRVLLRDASGQSRAFPYPRDTRIEVDKDIARGWVVWASRWAAPLVSLALLVVGTATSFVYRALVAVLLAAVGTPVAWAMGVSLPWSSRYRLAVVAMTPSIVIDTVLVFAARAFEMSAWAWLVLGALNVAVLVFALGANRRPGASIAQDVGADGSRG